MGDNLLTVNIRGPHAHKVTIYLYSRDQITHPRHKKEQQICFNNAGTNFDKQLNTIINNLEVIQSWKYFLLPNWIPRPREATLHVFFFVQVSVSIYQLSPIYPNVSP